MSNAANNLFDSINNYRDLKKLIDDGEAEGLHLECKSPESPTISRKYESMLAKSISGFANTEGGIIIWGMGTTNKSHNNLDILTQIEPIGNCKRFKKILETKMPLLTTPPITNYENKIITEKKDDTKGIIITYIPKVVTNPILNNKDNVFYFRSGDKFEPLPYELIKKLFATTGAPDINPTFNPHLIKLSGDSWIIPLTLINNSYKLARDVKVFVEFINKENCEKINYSPSFSDASSVNPGRKILNIKFDGVIYKSMPLVIEHMNVEMKRRKRSLKLGVEVFADNMIAKRFLFSIQLINNKFKVIPLGMEELE